VDRKNFFFRQKVTEQELDSAFDAVEQGVQDFVASFEFVGVATNAQVTEHAPANFTVDVQGPAYIYDKLFQRISFSADQNLNCAVDENGAATDVVGAGNEKYLSVFAHFQRLLSDPRTDGFGDTIYFEEAESFKLRLVQGAEAPSGTASRPPLDSTDILLADIRIVYGQTTIVNANIDDSRAELVYQLSGSPLDINERSLTDVLQAMLDEINSFTSGLPGDLADQTAPDDGATLIGIDSIAPSYGLYTSPQGTLKAMLADFLEKLQVYGSPSTPGSARIGSNSLGSGLFSLAAGTVSAQLAEICDNLRWNTSTADGASHVGMEAFSVGDFALARGSVRSGLSDLLTQLDHNSSSPDGASRVGFLQYNSPNGRFDISDRDVRTALTYVIDRLDNETSSPYVGSDAIGSMALGWLSAGSLRSQINAIQGAVARKQVTNDVYASTAFTGPLLDATHASDDTLYCLAEWGSGDEIRGLWVNVSTGSVGITTNLTQTGTGNTMEHIVLGPAMATVFNDGGVFGMTVARFATAAAGTNVGAVLETPAGSADKYSQIDTPQPGVADDGDALRVLTYGTFSDGKHTCHWSEGHVIGAGIGIDACVNFGRYFTSPPTSFTVNTTGTGNQTGTATVVNVTNYGCGISGRNNVGIGYGYSYGTLQVAP
jgi:hypothetical protein